MFENRNAAGWIVQNADFIFEEYDDVGDYMAFDTSATPTRVTDAPFLGKVFWTFTGTDSDASTAIDIVAAPSGGRSLYITHAIIVTAADADAFPQLQDGAATLLFGPFPSGTTGPIVIDHKFEQPIKVTAGKSLAVKCAAAGSVYVYVEGFTA
jgi:hypothetical protein